MGTPSPSSGCGLREEGEGKGCLCPASTPSTDALSMEQTCPPSCEGQTSLIPSQVVKLISRPILADSSREPPRQRWQDQEGWESFTGRRPFN